MITSSVAINDMTVRLAVEREQRTLAVTVLVGKPDGSDPIREDTVGLVIEDRDGRLLKATDWPTPGFLPETETRGTTASAEFRFEARGNSRLKRAIVIIRGTFGEIDLREA